MITFISTSGRQQVFYKIARCKIHTLYKYPPILLTIICGGHGFICRSVPPSLNPLLLVRTMIEPSTSALVSDTYLLLVKSNENQLIRYSDSKDYIINLNRRKHKILYISQREQKKKEFPDKERDTLYSIINKQEGIQEVMHKFFSILSISLIKSISCLYLTIAK